MPGLGLGRRGEGWGERCPGALPILPCTPEPTVLSTHSVGPGFQLPDGNDSCSAAGAAVRSDYRGGREGT